MTEPAGLYVHVPFCGSKCRYCDFYSVADQGPIPDWLQAVRLEWGFYKERFSSFDTVYLGGGTPSILPQDSLQGLLEDLLEELPLEAGGEITIEANPEHVTREGLSSYRSMGINRISIGVQSLDDRVLRFLGRRHTAEAGRLALELALDAGFRSVSADLIYAVPGLTMESWTETLERLASMGVHHLSCYELTIEEDTPLGREAGKGALELPGEEEREAFFLKTSRLLGKVGFDHYEVSNFARPGHQSRHNSKYWRRVPYLGLGPSAHSLLGSTRWWNHSSIDLYLDSLSRDARPLAGEERLSDEQEALEALMLGLRTNRGVEIESLPPAAGREGMIRILEEQGLAKRRGRRLIPTMYGFLLADGLPLLFL
ncbi:MAG: radical SAM family heme chaperone HemW [Desulfobacteraceae bacterium]